MFYILARSGHFCEVSCIYDYDIIMIYKNKSCLWQNHSYGPIPSMNSTRKLVLVEAGSSCIGQQEGFLSSLLLTVLQVSNTSTNINWKKTLMLPYL